VTKIFDQTGLVTAMAMAMGLGMAMIASTYLQPDLSGAAVEGSLDHHHRCLRNILEDAGHNAAVKLKLQ
jgi:hypothetical protein